ncbi:MAG: hypothetical protein ACI4XP_05540 [Acutalibacteraceae bacterium]
MNTGDLFDLMNAEQSDKNPFEITCTAYEELNKKVINPLYDKNYNEGWDAFLLLCDIIHDYQKKAFEVGFNAAVSLIVGKC